MDSATTDSSDPKAARTLAHALYDAAFSGRDIGGPEAVIEIAAGLGIAPTSVDTYRRRIMLKLGIRDLPGLVRFAMQHGIPCM